MKEILLSAAFAIGLAIPATAQTVPSYTTLNASGTTTAVVYFATSPQQQVRVVGAVASSDLGGANMLFQTGTTPLTVAYTNTAGTQVGVSRTNGFTVGDLVLIERANGTITNGQIASFGAATNIVFGQNVCATIPGDQIYKLGAATKLWVGVFTNRAFMGEAIFVGDRGRPVRVLVNGTSACSLDSVTARYE